MPESRPSKFLGAALYQRRRVDIAACVHYCGFRYGRNEFHPYEQYAVGISQHVKRTELRAAFIDFLRHYRPRDLGTALGAKLARHIPLWRLPWRRPGSVLGQEGWCSNVEQIPDLLTHFCEAGIPMQRIEQEFLWLEQGYERMSEIGYRPHQYGYIRCIELRDGAGSTYLVTDGNHRLAALHSLGIRTVEIEVARFSMVNLDRRHSWPLVRNGMVAIGDAAAIFAAYRRGNLHPYRATNPAALLP